MAFSCASRRDAEAETRQVSRVYYNRSNGLSLTPYLYQLMDEEQFERGRFVKRIEW
jgi:hypothetical protein